MPSIPSADVAYLFHLRLIHGCRFAQFLRVSGFEKTERCAEDWLEFFLIKSWREILVHQWRYEFWMLYGQSAQE